MKTNFLFVIVVVLSIATATAQSVDYLTPKSLSEVITVSLQPVRNGNKIPIITWGGDLQTIFAQQEGIFASNGLNLTLFKEDDFKKQVEMCLKGEIPAIRGTLAMINSAVEVFQKQGTDLVVVIGLTTSEGGDCMAVRGGKTLNNISTVALQLYGPHMDYAANLFTQNGRIGNIKFKWLQNLTVSDRINGKAIDPVTAFQSDNTLDAVMCITPDGLMLTSGGVGSGTDNSVKGAKILLSTETANKIIYDVYAFRKDYYDENTKQVEGFVKAMFVAEEKLRDLRKSKNAKFTQLIAKGVDYFSLSNADVEGMLGDCNFLGYNGNVSFFTGVGTTRNFKTLNAEISFALKTLGIVKTTPKVPWANWDFSTLSAGLTYASSAPVITKKFNQEKTSKLVETKISAESDTWEEEGTLFKLEIYFQPNQETFSIQDYARDFEKALNKAETYGGALVIIEGYSDPGGISKAKKNGEKQVVIQQMEQTAKNLSQKRAENVKKSFMTYCKNNGIVLDESQLVTTGRGTSSPKYAKPTTKEEWLENFRVVFVVKQVEAESEVFDPTAY